MERLPLQQSSQPQSSVPIEGEREIDLLELGYELLSKLKYIVLAAIVGGLLAAGYTFFIATPQYEATAKLYVLNSSDSVLNLSDLQLGNYLASDYIEVFKTWELHEMVRANLGLNYSYGTLSGMLNITNPTNTRILYITAKSPDPQEAAAVANEYAKVASEYVSTIMATEKPNILSMAIVPTSPVSPQKTRNLLLGLLLGLVAAAGVIVLRFVLDDSVKSPDDVTKYTGLPVLAVVPLLSDADDAKNKRKRSDLR